MTGTAWKPIIVLVSLPASSQMGRRPVASNCASIVRTKSRVRSGSMSVRSGWSARNVSQSEKTV